MALLPKIKLKSQTNFPSTAEGRFGIAVEKQNGNFFIDLDYSEFSTVPVAPLDTVTLFYNSTAQSYVLAPAVAGNGDVTGPASAVADRIAVFNGTTGKIIKDGGSTIAALAPLASPALTGNPTAPTPSPGDNDTSIATTAFVTAAAVLRSYLTGLTLSTAGSSATFGIAVGIATDSTNVTMLTLASAYTKTTAAWAVGSSNGSFDGTGAAPSATADWYHVYLIKRIDTGVVDILTSRSATAPTMPSPYTLFRRIGSMKTNGSFQWIKFIQDGDSFQWDVAVVDVDVTNPGSAAVTRTLSTPLGLRTQAIVYVGGLFTTPATDSTNVLLSDLVISDQAPSVLTVLSIGNLGGSTQVGMGGVMVMTNTSSQIRSRTTGTTAGTRIIISTTGWIDRRGKDA